MTRPGGRAAGRTVFQLSVRTRLRSLVLAALAVVVAGACGIGWRDQAISQVSVGEDDRTLVVGYHCDADASVVADETADQVRLTFRVYGSAAGDCARAEEVRLDAQLAGRQIIDASSGRTIAPCPLSTPRGDAPTCP